LIDEVSPANLSRVVRVFKDLFKTALTISVSVLLALYVLAIPLGLELFIFERLSATFSPSSSVSMTFFYVPLEVNMSLVFTCFLSVYALCFVLAWKQRNGFHKVISGFFSKPVSDLLKDSLFAVPVLSSFTYVVVDNIHFFQESFGIPTGKPPLPEDPLLVFLELSISPLTEEIIFRILPIGAFLLVSLLSLEKRRRSLTTRKRLLRFLFLTIMSPQGAKKSLGLKTVDDSGLRGGIILDEWVMILFTSAFFGFHHYFFTSTWNVGKITSTFVQGLVMGLSYLTYGIQAPILIHWFFNYYLYAYALAAIVHPNLAILNLLNEKLTSLLGILGLLMILCFLVRKLARARAFALKAPINLAERVKDNFAEKANQLSVSLRQLRSISFKSSIFGLATLVLVLVIFIVRLAIVNSPKPEVGERYYETGFIFDESYYVKAARKLLTGVSSNDEHPPLLKALIMVGITLFGDNPLGWRIFSIMASSVSVALLYGVTLFLTRNGATSFYAALLFATDIMAFNIGQIGMLDAPSMMFILAASILLLRRRYDFAGLFLGLASLCKVSSVFAAAGIIFFLLLWRPIEREGSLVKSLKERIPSAGRIFFIAFITFLIGLWIYDSQYGAFDRNPLKHLSFMFVYHNSLRYEDPTDVILPLQWINPLSPFSPVAYHVTTVREILNGGILREYHPTAYYGVYTPLWWGIWLIMPICLIETIRKAQKNEEQGIGLFVASWTAWNFFPYVVFGYFMQRWVYPFYFYMALPGLYMGLSYHSAYSRLSKVLLALPVSLQLFWFLIWFPVKPKIIIDLLFSIGLPS